MAPPAFLTPRPPETAPTRKRVPGLVGLGAGGPGPGAPGGPGGAQAEEGKKGYTTCSLAALAAVWISIRSCLDLDIFFGSRALSKHWQRTGREDPIRCRGLPPLPLTARERREENLGASGSSISSRRSGSKGVQPAPCGKKKTPAPKAEGIGSFCF